MTFTSAKVSCLSASPTTGVAMTAVDDTLTPPPIVHIRFVSSGPRVQAAAIVDSGASANFVSPAVAASLPRSSRCTSRLRVALADGSAVMATAVYNLSFKVGSSRFSSRFYELPGCAYECILGLPFIREHPHESWSWILDPAATPPSLPSDEEDLATCCVGAVRHQLRKGAVLLAVQSVADLLESPRIHPDMEEELTPLVAEFADVFSPPDGPPPDRGEFDHKVTLKPGAALPATPSPYRLSAVERRELIRMLRLLLERNWISRTSSAPFAAPCFFVAKRKADGSLGFRLVVDWRGLNSISQPSVYPLPNIQAIISSVFGAVIFTKLDLSTAFHQIRTRPADTANTVMTTEFGLFRWNVVSMGQSDSGSTMQALMDHVLSGLPACCCYLDDILVFSRRSQDHPGHVRAVLLRLRQHHLCLGAGKCYLGYPQLDFLGYMLSKDGVAAHPDKLRAIAEWPTPSSSRDLRSFLGLCGYIRQHIRGYAALSAPLYALCGTPKAPLRWSVAADLQFQALKAALVSPSTLAIPDPMRPFDVEVDASDAGIGAALFQDGRPVEFASRSYNGGEANRIVRDKELLAAVFACRRWRHFLHGCPFVLHTDHQPLTSIALTPDTAKHVTQSVIFLEQFRYTWAFRKGSANPAADALSRYPVQAQPPIASAAAVTVVRAASSSALTRAMSAAYAADPFFSIILEHLSQPNPPTSSYIYSQFFLRDQLIFTRAPDGDRLCVPDDRSIRAMLLHAVHAADAAGHPGVNRTLDVARRHYFWRGMAGDVASFVRSCPVCQRVKADHLNPPGLLHPLEAPEGRWLCISIDFAVGLPLSSGYQAVLLVVDRFTRRLRLLPVPSMSIDALATANLLLRHIVPMHGLFQSIVSDRDPRFTAEVWDKLWASLGVRLQMGSAAHPETDGSTERAVRSMKQYLTSLCMAHPGDWAEKLPLVEFAFNSHVNTSTGLTPFFADLGRHPLGPVDLVSSSSPPSPTATALATSLHSIAAQLLDAGLVARTRQAHAADRHRRPHEFRVGDEVFVRSTHLLSPAARALPRPLRPRFAGPFRIAAVVSGTSFRLELPPGRRAHPVFHASVLRPSFIDEWPERGQPPPATDDGEFEVEAILAHRCYPRRRSPTGRPRGGKSQFLVSWLGYPPDDATWQSLSDLHFNGVVCQALLDYLDQHGLPHPQ